MISIQNLNYFMKICETGSMNRAADQLFISQPALSLAMKNLETELKTELLIRSNRGVEITENGRRLYQHGKTIMRQLDLIESFTDFRGETQLSVSAFPFLVWPGIFSQMRNSPDFSHTQFAYREGRTLQILHDVEDMTSEIGILQYNDRQAPFLARRFEKLGLTFQPVCRRRWSVVLGEHNPLFKRQTVSLEELSGYRMVRLKDDDMSLLTGSVPAVRDQMMDELSCDYVESTNVILELLRETSSYMFLCDQKHFVNDPTCLRILPVRGADVHDIQIGYICKSGIRISDAAQFFLQRFSEEI